MTVVILDTNALPRGNFSLTSLERLQRTVGQEAAILVPEVVVWEWAEHARASYVAVEEAAKAIRTDASILERPHVPPAPSVEEIAERIIDSLPTGVSIWTPPSEVWREALRDQVMQIGSGEIKGLVKTGAADAVVLACVEAESDQAEDVVLLLTNDKKLRNNASRFENVRCASGDQGLLAAIYTFTPATEDLIVRLMEDLPEFLNAQISEEGKAISFDEYGVGEYLGRQGIQWPANIVLSTIKFQNVLIAEVDDLQVQANEGSRRGLADLRLFGDIVCTILEYHDTEPGETTVSRSDVDFNHEFVDVTIEVQWDLNWRISAVRATGTALLVFIDEEEADGDDVATFKARPAT